MDERTTRELKRALAKTIFSIGVFLLIAAGWGYITAANDPGHDDRSQLIMLGVGAVMTTAGRLLRKTWV